MIQHVPRAVRLQLGGVEIVAKLLAEPGVRLGLVFARFNDVLDVIHRAAKADRLGLLGRKRLQVAFVFGYARGSLRESCGIYLDLSAADDVERLQLSV